MTGFSYNVEYIKKLVSGLLIVCGVFLLIEHLFTFGGFDFFDVVGHETYGLLMIIAAILISMKWKQVPAWLDAVKSGNLKAIFDEGKR